MVGEIKQSIEHLYIFITFVNMLCVGEITRAIRMIAQNTGVG